LLHYHAGLIVKIKIWADNFKKPSLNLTSLSAIGQFLTPEALLSGHSELPKQTFNKNYATHFKIYEMD
jgi:hypothetical protein